MGAWTGLDWFAGKSTFIVRALRVLLVSVLNSARWSVLITWNVKSHLKDPHYADL